MSFACYCNVSKECVLQTKDPKHRHLPNLSIIEAATTSASLPPSDPFEIAADVY
jgi:hypothetical protein